MKKHIFIIIVTIITLVMSLPLLSCQSGAVVTQTTPSTATEKATDTASAVKTSVPVSATPAESTTAKPGVTPPATTTTTPTQSTTTPTATPDLPDLKPYLVDGKSAITVDISNPDYKKFLIKAGVTNAGQVSANNVNVELYNYSTKIYTWNVGQLKNGENRILQATVEDILKQSQIFAGQYSLSINCVLSGGGKEIAGSNNKSDTYKAILALPPVAEQQGQSATIQYSLKNSTWFTESNRAEFMAILKDVLKDANISWNTFYFEIMSFDKFNDFYANSVGTTAAEKQQIKQSLTNNKLYSYSYLYGMTDSVNICIREGTLIQMLPMAMYQLGRHDYAQINYGGYSISYKIDGARLAGSLMETYGIRVMREKDGFGGLTNMSAILNTVQYPSLTGTSSSSVNLRRMWAVFADTGYPNGDMPADKILKAFFNLTVKPDPTSYMADLDKKADLLDKAAIENIIRWRLVNKELTPLPADIAQKMGGSSLDLVISYQEFVAFPW